MKTIEQQMAIASVWNGAAPVGTPTSANDIGSNYPEGSVGGLFDFGNVNPFTLRQVMVKFGTGTTSWTLSLVDADTVETVLASGANADPLFSYGVGPLAGLIILQGQKLKLVSVGVTSAISVARMSASNDVRE